MAETTNDPHGSHGHGHEHDPDVNPDVSHETRDVNVFQISAFGIGLLLACIVTVFAMWVMFRFLFNREDAKNANNPAAAMMSERQKEPPKPQLQAEPKLELRDLRTNEDTMLHSYGWVDQGKGIVRIPIDQAIDIVSQKGLPSKPSPAGMENDGYRTIPEDSSSGRTLEKIAQ
jgi:hypothetical protein